MNGPYDPRNPGGPPAGGFGQPQQPQQQWQPQQQPYGAPPQQQQWQQQQPAMGYAHGAAGAGMCEACGVMGETKDVRILRNIGAVVIRFTKTMSGNLCRRCISDYHWKYTTATMLVGWCGYLSLVIAPIYGIMNTITWLRSLGMRQPTDAEYAQAPGNTHRGMAGWLVALVSWGALFLLAVIVTIIGAVAG